MHRKTRAAVKTWKTLNKQSYAASARRIKAFACFLNLSTFYYYQERTSNSTQQTKQIISRGPVQRLNEMGPHFPMLERKVTQLFPLPNDQFEKSLL